MASIVRRVAAAVLCAAAAVATVGAFSPPQTIFSSKSVGVRVDALVTEHGKPVPGLTASDFELRDNGVVQTIAAVESSDLSVNVVLALDVSASIAGARLADLRAATSALVGDLKPVDRASLITFNHAVSPRVPLTSAFTTITRVLGETEPSGATAILDGVYVAMVTTQSEAGRSLVVVCTDGRDTASWLQADEVLESAKRSNAVVYTVATGGARNWSVLKDLADATGGQSLEIAASKDLKSQFERILQEFRSRYMLTYVPYGVAEGGFHTLQVKVRRGGVTIKARPGYIGGAVE